MNTVISACKQHSDRFVETTIAQGRAVYASFSATSLASDNQDSIALIPVDHASAVLVLSDGAGGHPGGDAASKNIIKAVINYALENRNEGQLLRDCILTALDFANQQIIESRSGAGATACIAIIEERSVRPFYAGDSTIVIAGQRGKLIFKNTQHSPVGYVEKSELFDDRELSKLERTNEVLNLVGDQSMHIEIGPSISLKLKDTLLICSDGFTDNLSIEEIINCIRTGTLQQAAQRLSQLNDERIKAGGHIDDRSFILYRNHIE